MVNAKTVIHEATEVRRQRSQLYAIESHDAQAPVQFAAVAVVTHLASAVVEATLADTRALTVTTVTATRASCKQWWIVLDDAR